MELTLTREQEAQLGELAEREGKSVSELLTDTAISLIQIDDREWAAVDRAIAQADRGELIEEDEMEARIAKMLAR